MASIRDIAKQAATNSKPKPPVDAGGTPRQPAFPGATKYFKQTPQERVERVPAFPGATKYFKNRTQRVVGNNRKAV